MECSRAISCSMSVAERCGSAVTLSPISIQIGTSASIHRPRPSTMGDGSRRRACPASAPRLVRNLNIATLTYGEDAFDYVIGQSVFSRLLPPEIDARLESFAGIMGANTSLFFTYNDSPEPI